MKAIAALLLILLLPQAVAQDPPVQEEPAAAEEIQEGELVHQAPGFYEKSGWLSIEIVLSVGVLVFAFAVLVLEALIILKSEKRWPPQSIMQVFGLTLILSMALLLIIAGYNQDQIAPVMGLMGVIAGYLLGNNERQQGSA